MSLETKQTGTSLGVPDSNTDRGLDIAFLEASQPEITKRFNRISHYDYGNLRVFLDLSDVTVDRVDEVGGLDDRPLRKKNENGSSYEFWEIDDFFTDQIMTWMGDSKVPKLTEADVKEGLGISLRNYLEGVAIADITEAGIIAYPTDINYVFNPLDLVTPQRWMQITGEELSRAEIIDMYKDIPTNALFPPIWATQEFYHTDVGLRVLKGAGYDMRDHKKRKMAWQAAASTPRPQNTPRGTFYTDFQEGSTTNYYGKASRIAHQLSELSWSLGKLESYMFWQASSKAFAITGREEAGHRTYIRATRLGAIRNGDAEIRSYAYEQWAQEAVHVDSLGKPTLYMPGYFISDFGKGSLRAERAGLYGRLEALKSLDNTLRVSDLTQPGDLTTSGEKAVDELRAHQEFIASIIKSIEEDKASSAEV